MRFLQAEQLFNGVNFEKEVAVMVLNDAQEFVEFIRVDEIDEGRVEKHKGCITPGFLNAHCHLELSHLKGKIPEGTGLTGFAKHIMGLRQTFSEAEILEHMKDADAAMWELGIVAVGDICNLPNSFKLKADSRIRYHSFVELISLHPAMAQATFEQGKELLNQLQYYGLQGSLVPHAPYSVSEDLMRLLANEAVQNSRMISIHNQESRDETAFLMGEPGGIRDLYAFLNIDISWYRAPVKSGLSYLGQLMPESLSLFVHNTFSTEKDVDLGRNMGAFWCFCPQANYYIERTQPRFDLFKDVETKCCFGTDSLASNHKLDLLAEANMLAQNSSQFSLESILSMLTTNAAKALGLQDQLGTFIKGKNTGLNLLQFNDKDIRFIKKLS
ncbi:MAG TPA: amidohydrolase family protein [Bacteroidia bacterium]|nr:amidohydrolase family protein [Bacteroidia bacterium]